MPAARYRIPIALAALVAWIGITALSRPRLDAPTDIVSLVDSEIAWNIVAAGVFLLVLARVMGWRDLGFAAPRPWSSLKVLVFPGLYLALFAGLALAVGPPPAGTAAIIGLNMLAVGLSEELMFRGVLFRALVTRLPLMPAVWFTSAAFGAVHVLNAIVTGDLFVAAVQAVAAFMTGVFLMAVVLRTGSILPAMLYHAAWNFLLILTASGVEGMPGSGAPMDYGWAEVALPLGFILPNFLYGVWVLRTESRSITTRQRQSTEAPSRTQRHLNITHLD